MRLNPWQLPSSSGFVFFSTHICLDLKFAQNVGLALALALLSWLLTRDPTSCSALMAWICMAALCPPWSSCSVTTSGLGRTGVWLHSATKVSDQRVATPVLKYGPAYQKTDEIPLTEGRAHFRS